MTDELEVLDLIWESLPEDSRSNPTSGIWKASHRLPRPVMYITVDGECWHIEATRHPHVDDHELLNNGTKNAQGQIWPRPRCTCGEVMPVGIKTSPRGWHNAHRAREYNNS